MANILVFGASTTYGCWDSGGGWVARLRRFLDEKNIQEKRYKDYSKVSFVYNLGISDETAADILERFEIEAKPRLWEKDIFIFFVGLNDALIENKTNNLRTPINIFQQQIEELIKKAKEYSQQVIFIGTLPVDERVDPIPWLPTHSYKNEYVKEYNEIIKSACQVNNVHFIEIYDKVIDTDYSKLLEDGVHGNSEGHQFIFEEVKSYLLNNHIIEA